MSGFQRLAAATCGLLGAIRAKARCLECHSTAKEGDLLGAFTYYLDTPVDRLDANRVRE